MKILAFISLSAAGGLATYLHADAIGAYLPQNIKFRAIADAGYAYRLSYVASDLTDHVLEMSLLVVLYQCTPHRHDHNIMV